MRHCLAVALTVLAHAATADPPALELSAHVVVVDGPREFGGLSALNVFNDGARAQVLSDQGKFFEVALLRDDSDRLTRVAVLQAKYLYVYEPQHRIDSEGLARAPDGGIFVSSENPEAVMHYPEGSHWPDRTWPVPDPDSWPINRGLEALAIDSDGRLVTIPEKPSKGEADFPVFRLEHGAWRRIATLKSMDTFSVVGADFAPDGRLYVLERSFSALGFRTRIRRFTLSEEVASGVDAGETLFQSRIFQFDNLEGISLWRDRAGATRILLVSDNNFLAVQRTEFVEFVLRE